MSLTLTIVADSGAVSLIEVSPQAQISLLAQLIHVETTIPPPQQALLFNGRPLPHSNTVSAAGLVDGDLIMVSRSAVAPAQHDSDHAVLASLRANAAFMQRLRTINPQMHEAVQNGDPGVLAALQNMYQQGRGQAGGHVLGNRASDPMSADAQKAIEERIRMENVMENMEAAMEHNPESFGSVVMLFVDCKVNSKPGVKAFVDSGAQATIISKACAERCNILRLMDTRFAGTAVGVGSAKIHGRIHLALLTLGNEVFEVSFTVMDAVGGSYDMLLGLDMLRKHQASIDLRDNCLKIGSASVPFLAEKDIPKAMRSERHAPTADGVDEVPVPVRPAPGSASRMIPAASTQPAPPASNRGASGAVARSAAGGSVSNEAVSGLVAMGFSSQQAEEALRVCNGNTEHAAAMLAASKYGF